MPACLNTGYAGICTALFLYIVTARIAVNILLQAPQMKLPVGYQSGKAPASS